MKRRHLWSTQVIINLLKSGAKSKLQIKDEMLCYGKYSWHSLRIRIDNLIASGEVEFTDGKYQLKAPISAS